MLNKQNPMNFIVKVTHVDGSIDINEMSPSSFTEFAREIYNGMQRHKRKQFHKELNEGKTFTLSDKRVFMVIK